MPRERKGSGYYENIVGSRRVTHPISLSSDVTFDDSAVVDDDKYSQPKHHRA